MGLVVVAKIFYEYNVIWSSVIEDNLGWKVHKKKKEEEKNTIHTSNFCFTLNIWFWELSIKILEGKLKPGYTEAKGWIAWLNRCLVET